VLDELSIAALVVQYVIPTSKNSTKINLAEITKQLKGRISKNETNQIRLSQEKTSKPASEINQGTPTIEVEKLSFRNETGRQNGSRCSNEQKESRKTPVKNQHISDGSLTRQLSNNFHKSSRYESDGEN
jgi:hypothetical protein